MASNSSSQHRNDLQGLRALAVLAVLFFHIWPDGFVGGFVGVDVFFVISGFLITGLLVKEIEVSGRLDLGMFWSRRLRRLLPAATLVCMVSLWAAYKWVPETDWINTAKQTFASGLYFQNWMLVSQQVDYMARESSATVVQHYWSLSIEEQFYFGWPLVVFFAAAIARKSGKNIRRLTGWISAAIFGVSLALSILVYRGSPEGYFITNSRAWELALGASLAILWPALNLSRTLRVIGSWLGLALVVGSVFLVRQNDSFPGYVALFPTLGTVLLILGNQARGAAGTLLGMQPLRFIGDISYAVYLWHWPLVIVVKQIPELAVWPAWQQSSFIIGSTIALAIATKYIVEDPFRHGILAFGFKQRNRKLFVTGSLITAAALIMVGGTISGYRWIEEVKRWQILQAKEKAIIHPPADYPGAAAMDPLMAAAVPTGKTFIPNPLIAEHDMDGKHAHCMGRTGSYAVRPCEFGNRQGEKFIVLAGDSHAMQYGTALEKVARLHNWRLLVLTKPACPFGDFPVYYEGWERAECRHWKKEVLKILTAEKPDLMIVGTARAGLFGQIAAPEKQVAGYKAYWQKFLDAGIRMAVVRDNPLMRGGPYGWMSPPACVYRFKDQPKNCENPRHIALEKLKDYLVTAQNEMRDQVSLIDLSDLFCTKEQCPAVIGNILVYRDQHHVTDAYGKTLAPYLDKIVKKLLLTPAPQVVSRPDPAPGTK
jgi:peptidoglycan/LPS O-acetylase OafA/YrhL